MAQSTEGRHLATDDLWALLDGDLVDYKDAQSHLNRCAECFHRWQSIRKANSAIKEALTIEVDATVPKLDIVPEFAIQNQVIPSVSLETREPRPFVVRRATRRLNRWWLGGATFSGVAVALIASLVVGFGHGVPPVTTSTLLAAAPVAKLTAAGSSNGTETMATANGGMGTPQNANDPPSYSSAVTDAALQQSAATFSAHAETHGTASGSTALSTQAFTVKVPDGSTLAGVHVAIVAAGYILASGDTHADGTLQLKVQSTNSQILTSGGTSIPQLAMATVVLWKNGYQPIVVYGQPLWNGQFDIRTAATMRLLTDVTAPVQIVAAGAHRTAPSASLSAQTLLTPQRSAPPTLAQVELLVLWTELQMTKPDSSTSGGNTTN